MAISDTLSSIITNLSNAYDQIGTMGGTIPLSRNMNNLANAIGTIPSGSGGAYDYYDVITCTISSINNSSAQYVGLYALAKNSQLTEVSLPNCKVINNYGFYDCSALTSIYMPLCQEVADRGLAYCGISYFEMPKCLYIGQYAFASCPNLSTIYINYNTDPYTSTPTSISNFAFYSCTNLSNLYIYGEGIVTLPSRNTANIFSGTKISSAAQGGHIYVHPDWVASYKAAVGWSVFANRISSIPS